MPSLPICDAYHIEMSGILAQYPPNCQSLDICFRYEEQREGEQDEQHRNHGKWSGASPRGDLRVRKLRNGR
jgi:hypothetical protein